MPFQRVMRGQANVCSSHVSFLLLYNNITTNVAVLISTCSVDPQFLEARCLGAAELGPWHGLSQGCGQGLGYGYGLI